MENLTAYAQERLSVTLTPRQRNELGLPPALQLRGGRAGGA
ncbi:hypothetical protein [Catellatospora sp. TT07R-123]|nr:hypothetical protein [Catellatospora sp. TT07R-123]